MCACGIDVDKRQERNVANPTDEDIRKIRHDIMEVITRAGADAATVDISIEIDLSLIHIY